MDTPLSVTPGRSAGHIRSRGQTAASLTQGHIFRPRSGEGHTDEGDNFTGNGILIHILYGTV